MSLGMMNFFRHPRIGGRKNRRNGEAKGKSLTFRKEEGSVQVSMPVYSLHATWHRFTLRIDSRSVSVNKINDTPRHIATRCRRQLTRSLKDARKRFGPGPLDVIINSRGGVTSAALGYAQALRRWRGEKRCVIDGECSSAATLIAFLPKWEITVTPGSSMLIHHARKMRYNKHTKRVYKNGAIVSEIIHWSKLPSGRATRTTDRDFERLYRRRTGKPIQTIREWMDVGKRFSAVEMCAFGFADEMKPIKR